MSLEEDYSKWMKNVNNMVGLGSAYTKLSYYNPKNEYSTLTKTYYIYFQPCLLLLLSVWLIALIRALWTDDYIKKFGFMTLYSFFDLLTLIVQSIFLLYAFTRKKNYLEYRICYVFEICTRIVPRVLIFVSQWLKVAQVFQRFIILYKPINYKMIFNARSVTVFFVVIVIALGSLLTKSILSINFERVVIIDRASMKNVEICRKPGFFYPEIQFTLTNHVTVDSILLSVFESILPFIFMSILSVASIIVIRKHIKFRMQFQAGRSSLETDIGSERLVKVTIVTTICFAIITVPMLPLFVVMPNADVVQTLEYISIVCSALYIINIPVSFLLFSWLSGGFRETLKTIWKRLTRQSDNVQIEHQNIVLRKQNTSR